MDRHARNGHLLGQRPAIQWVACADLLDIFNVSTSWTFSTGKGGTREGRVFPFFKPSVPHTR